MGENWYDISIILRLCLLNRNLRSVTKLVKGKCFSRQHYIEKGFSFATNPGLFFVFETRSKKLFARQVKKDQTTARKAFCTVVNVTDLIFLLRSKNII